ncbi:ABC-three component system middle component 2 [Pseudogracilibacillus sp. ICA-222130]|uniref:ABC-three component system middle component 2 n=1 Tax=Pseudogracilibacillus sp. ICA-222130 TaxID=3134655 RepID=UPI0030BE15D5
MNKIFNTPFETSLRILIILESEQSIFSTDKLAAIDFISTYGSEFNLSKQNLHGENTFKFAEFSYRREMVHDAIKELVLKDLISIELTNNGFYYYINNTGISFITKLNSSYANQYRSTLKKCTDYIKQKNEQELLNILASHSLTSLKEV